MNVAQTKYLEQFIAAYVQRTRASRARRERGWPALADPRASSGFSRSMPADARHFWLATKRLRYSLVGVRCEGPHVWDLDGNAYIDFALGFGVHYFGHRPRFILDALTERLAYGAPMGFQSEVAAENAAGITDLTGDERVAFCNTGTEAVMIAVRLARAATGRTKIVVFEDSYHGSYDDVVGGIHATLGVAPSHTASTLVLRYDDAASLDVISEHAEAIAAVVVEPVQARHLNVQPAAFLRELRALTASRDIALIVDDVMQGFRAHRGGSQSYFGVRADLATYGKIIGGGMPIGVVAGRAEYLDYIDGGRWRFEGSDHPKNDKIWFAGTFNKNPLTMAAMRAVIGRLKTTGTSLQEEQNRRTGALTHRLAAWLERESFPIRVARYGSMFTFVMPPLATLLVQHLHLRGIYTWEGWVFFVSPAHSDAHLQALEEAVRDSLSTMRREGYLP
ncbi:aminotransferase class III-fold pyridoxal phosphate-dependent enzyme [Pendulispora albinea]|uniref:Aminotransferase class III-fold pyridoxal phosphate-dependent enzyme n=1 Tax=Pendulispora albinea TaxID=2741071 RepID=A0ABZ2MBH5_9BACT